MAEHVIVHEVGLRSAETAGLVSLVPQIADAAELAA